MTWKRQGSSTAFSLVEVVLAIGIVAFAVLSTFGLLSVATDTNKRSRDDQASAQIARNEFQRIRSLSSADPMWATSPPTYNSRYFANDLSDLGTSASPPPGAIYQLQITVTFFPDPPPTPPTSPADFVFNAEVHYPVTAPPANQNIVRFTTLMNRP
jgi:uncharacterized protein (TIGR02598 family)